MFLKKIISSLKRSRRLIKLQKIIAASNIDDIIANFSDSSKRRKEEHALEKFWDLCMENVGVMQVMSDYDLSRNSLNEIYYDLLGHGAGQWVRGHYVALSVLAYNEPFLYYMIAKKDGLHSGLELALILVEYFKKPVGSLYKSLSENGYDPSVRKN